MSTRHCIFDWGDTLMRDDPASPEPMYLWPSVELMPEVDVVLARLVPTASLSIATGAAISDETMVRRALERVGIARHFETIFTTAALGAKKSDPEFWRRVLARLRAKPEEVTMVGDNFEPDVLAPVSLGIRAVWFNWRSDERRSGPGYSTVGRLTELLGDGA